MISDMNEDNLQLMCERGQRELMETQYLQAIATFTQVEQTAWDLRAFDTLARLYLPLQESRRQIRQRCGEGVVKMHLSASGLEHILQPIGVLAEITCGQVIAGGWGTIKPSVDLRRLAAENQLYVEAFLAAVFPVIDCEPVVVLVPTSEIELPAPLPRSLAELKMLLPINSLLLAQTDLPADAARGNSETFAGVMALWERLHAPYLEAAKQITNPIERMQAYRTTLLVDPACELAHQFLADIARSLARQR